MLEGPHRGVGGRDFQRVAGLSLGRSGARTWTGLLWRRRLRLAPARLICGPRYTDYSSNTAQHATKHPAAQMAIKLNSGGKGTVN